MVQRGQVNLAPYGLRVVVTAWMVALVVAATLAATSGIYRLAELERAAAISDNESQFFELSNVLGRLYQAPRQEIEQNLLSGRTLTGVTEAEIDRVDGWGVGDEGSLFRPASQSSSSTQPTKAEVFRTTIDGSLIAPRYAGWNIRLKFVNDLLRSASAVDPRRASLQKPIKGGRPIESAMGWTIVIAGSLAVICLIAVGPVGRHFRRQVALVGLAAAVLVIVVTAVHLTAYRSPLLVSENAKMAWALITFTLGLAAFAPVARAERSFTACRSCGYDLTGNVSGCCPECGLATTQGKVDRWESHAVAIEQVRDDRRRFQGTVALCPLSLELKVAAYPDQMLRFIRALAGGPVAGYRYNMSDPLSDRAEPEPKSLGPDLTSPEMSASAAAEDQPAVVCPACNYTITTAESPEESLTYCPACGADLEAVRAEADFQREQALRIEVERRQRDQQLNEVRIKQVLTERRSLFRTRSYFVVLGTAALVIAIQIAIYSVYRLQHGGFSFRVGAYIAAFLPLLLLMRFCWRKIRQYNLELATPLLPEPAADPDFSTLSDGTQRLDSAAENLDRLYKQS